MEKRRHSENFVSSEGLSFSEKLEREIKDKKPDYFDFTIDDVDERESEIILIEEGIKNSELEGLLGKYGISGISIELDRTIEKQVHGDVDGSAETRSETVYSIAVSTHFSNERLPDGYAYKGGAARALLLRSLGIDPMYIPRDVDIVRLADTEPYDGADDELAAKFMPEDLEFGPGVEHVDDTDKYFDDRDLTINEVLATDSKITMTEACLQDTIRRIIRPTNFEQFNYSKDGDLGPKMLAKILRFYVESIHRWDEASIQGVADSEFEENFIRPFWLALQLDRAFDISAAVAERYVDELKERNQIPEDIVDARDASEFLSSMMSHKPFHFRHAPSGQFRMEDDWLEEEYETSPRFRGHGRSRGEK